MNLVQRITAALSVLLISATATYGQCPPQELTHLFASDGAEGDIFGYAVALDGDTAIIGAHNDDTPAGTNAGSVYVYVRDAGGDWTLQARLFASDAAAEDIFGYAVALDDDTLLVGARNDNLPGLVDAGSVYVFVRDSGGVWTQQAQLIASDAAAGDGFGESLALDGDTAVIGAPFDHPPGLEEVGAAYVFVRTGEVWTQQARFPGAAEYEFFGGSVAISGDTAVIAPFRLATAGPPPGKALVFVRSGGAWTLQAQLSASDGHHDDHFGTSLALAGDTLVVGAHLDDTTGGINTGSASVFVRDGAGVWTQEALLVAADGAANDFFGVSVAVSGDTVIVGANGDNTPGGSDAGSAYVFQRAGGVWTQQAQLFAADGAPFDVFGASVALDGDTALIGSYSDDTPADFHVGSVHVYTLKPLVADLDGDGVVGLPDLTLLLGSFGCTAGPGACAGDVDADGDVDLNDLTALLSGFGQVCP